MMVCLSYVYRFNLCHFSDVRKRKDAKHLAMMAVLGEDFVSSPTSGPSVDTFKCDYYIFFIYIRIFILYNDYPEILVA